MTRTHVPRIALIGCGYWGKNLARDFAELRELAYICDADWGRAQKMAASFGCAVVSFEKALGDPEIAAIVVAAPADQHANIATQALHANKHVFVEKPLALDLREAEALVDLARSTDQVLMVGHLLQYHPVFLKLRELVAGGAIGPVRYIYSNRLSLGKVRREENVLWSFAPHDISMVLTIAGCEPDAVDAHGVAFLGAGREDVTTLNLKFPNGIRAHIFSSWAHPFKEQRLVVIGDDGMLVFEDHRPWEEKLAHYPHRFEIGKNETIPVRGTCDFVHVHPGEPLKNECQHFIECITNCTRARTDGEEGLRVLRVLSDSKNSLRDKAKRS